MATKASSFSLDFRYCYYCARWHRPNQSTQIKGPNSVSCWVSCRPNDWVHCYGEIKNRNERFPDRLNCPVIPESKNQPHQPS